MQNWPTPKLLVLQLLVSLIFLTGLFNLVCPLSYSSYPLLCDQCRASLRKQYTENSTNNMKNHEYVFHSIQVWGFSQQTRPQSAGFHTQQDTCPERNQTISPVSMTHPTHTIGCIHSYLYCNGNQYTWHNTCWYSNKKKEAPCTVVIPVSLKK